MLPPKPLKILTLDGGGLQAISTLLILDKLLDTIAKTNKVSHGKPRPCDVFDTIAGIGAGGWLAILLGRFHMDITTCLSEWYNIIQNIAPRSKTEKLLMRTMHHCYFDPKRLTQQIDDLTKVYNTGNFLFDKETPEVRTRHVFVAALRSDATVYNLFRTYGLPEKPAHSSGLLEGPEDPSKFKISSAFGVTGSTKYFSPPWEERMSHSGQKRFSDNKFPNPHNITELALDEMWAIYGHEVDISVVVNIGPGLPSKHDVQKIAKRFSWGSGSSLNIPFRSKRSRSPVPEEHLPRKKRTKTDPIEETGTVRFLHSPVPNRSVMPAKKQDLAKRDTFTSIQGRTVAKKLKRKEEDIENDIKQKLILKYGEKGETLYYRLAPLQAPQGTAQNDSSAPGLALDATEEYLEQAHVIIKIDEISDRLPMVPVSC